MTLVDKSLLRWDGVARYDLHELVRQYASEKLREIDAEAQIRDHHLTYFLKLAEQAELELIGPRQISWLRHLDDELDNLRAALEWSVQNDILAGLQLASALRRYWEGHSALQEGIGWLTQLLRHPRAAAHTAIRAKALTALGWLNAWQNDYASAREQAAEGLALYRALGDQHGVASALLVLGWALSLHEGYAAARPLWFESLALYRALGDTFGITEVLGMLGAWESNQDDAQARAYLEEGLTLCRELGDIMGMSGILDGLGVSALRHGDLTAARAWLTEALALQRSLGSAGVASVIGRLGELALGQGEYEQARAYFEESVALCRESGQTMYGLWGFVRLGYVALRQGDAGRAGALLVEGLQRFKDVGNRIGVVYTLEGLASLAVAQGRPTRAVRIFAWADAMRGAIANARPPVEQADVDHDFASIRTQLDEATIETARAEGRAMTLEYAIAYAAEGAPQTP
jgi:tetratricopeptide (TPR) repeat protein